jgi:hypothetical protein
MVWGFQPFNQNALWSQNAWNESNAELPKLHCHYVFRTANPIIRPKGKMMFGTLSVTFPFV